MGWQVNRRQEKKQVNFSLRARQVGLSGFQADCRMQVKAEDKWHPGRQVGRLALRQVFRS
jgi:hypothetical protein